MDVTARIEEVIAAKGLTKSKVAERMGKFNQAFNRLITNPKWETIELVAQAIGITTEELLYGSIPDISENLTGHQPLPICLTDNLKTIGILICPCCGKGISIKTEIV